MICAGPGPLKWGQAFTACGGSSQSPIDVSTSDFGPATIVENTSPFVFSSAYSAPPADMILENKGHTGTYFVKYLDWIAGLSNQSGFDSIRFLIDKL
jgi:hypothetical protein